MYFLFSLLHQHHQTSIELFFMDSIAMYRKNIFMITKNAIIGLCERITKLVKVGYKFFSWSWNKNTLGT